MTSTAPPPADDPRRRLGVFGATLVGVGGIVGGGVLVLAGVAFQSAGAGAIVAFAINGLIAFITAMSVAEISTSFPESGGAYTFAKKVLSVRAAFAVGWVLWFAYIVAAVLYAISFAAFTIVAIGSIMQSMGRAPPGWLTSQPFLLLLGSLATAAYSFNLARKAAGGGNFANIGKVVVFAFLILAGAVALARQPVSESTAALDPFFFGGIGGLIAAMGFTFISLQGFEMIAGIAGEVKDPSRTIPRAIFTSLFIALVIYLPILFIVATAGVPEGSNIEEMARIHGDAVVAAGVREFLGEPGYWFVMVAIILSTLSALNANLLTASRVSLAMANDHTLPLVLRQTHATRGTPVMAIYATGLTVVAILFMIPDLAAAGAAASLIFLLAFALTHVTAYLARKRGGPKLIASGYKTPMFPLVPVVGGMACVALAVFQAIVVPQAGGIMLIWLGLGVMLYFSLFKSRAETFDASAEALDPRLARLRGKNPLVLVPIANPRNASALVEVANAMAPSEYARVLLLTIVRAQGEKDVRSETLDDAQAALRSALLASFEAGHAPEALITAAPQPWDEIRRVTEVHDCESMLLGLSDTPDALLDRELEDLLNEVDCDVAVLHAPANWHLGSAPRVLVPVGGKGDEHELRARLLGTLCRDVAREIRFLTVLPSTATDSDVHDAAKSVSRMADMNIPVLPRVDVIKNDDPASAILDEAKKADLILLGLRRGKSGRRVFGKVALRIAREAPCAVMLLSRRPYSSIQGYYMPIQRRFRDTVQDAVGVIPWTGRRH